MTKKKKFKPVPQVKGPNVPKKYVSGAKNSRARMSEILATRKKYKEGSLTPAEMDRISKQRAKG